MSRRVVVTAVAGARRTTTTIAPPTTTTVPVSTTTTTTPHSGSLSLSPPFGPPGSVTLASGTNCAGTTPQAVVTFIADADPSTVLSNAFAQPDAHGDWQTFLQVHGSVAAGGAYSVTGLCLETSSLPPHVLFAYGPAPFTVTSGF